MQAPEPVYVMPHNRRPPPRRNMLRKRGESPSLPDEAWRIVFAFIEAGALVKNKAPPATLVKLSMVSRQLRRMVYGDGDLWYRLLVRHENGFFDRARRKHHYTMTFMHHAVPGLHFSPRPDYEVPTSSLNYFGFYPGQRVPPREPPDNYPAWPQMCIKDQVLTPEQRAEVVEHAKRSLRINYVHRCGGCGARGKHTAFWGLGMRVCASCRMDRFISGAALFAECGVDFWKAFQAIAGSVYFYTIDGRNRAQLASCSASPHDRLSQERAVAAKMHPQHIFFWRAHLEEALGGLQARRDAHWEPSRQRAKAALVAAGRALFVRLTIAQRGKPVSAMTSHLFFMSDPSQKKEADLVALHAPSQLGWYPSHLTLQGAKRERARAALQRAFLEHAGRLTLPSLKGQSTRQAALRAIRRHEAERAVDLGWYPQVSVSPPGTGRWGDLATHRGREVTPGAALAAVEETEEDMDE